MTDLPRERAPNPALEDRVVSALVASGLVRPRRRRTPVWLATAAALLVAIGLSWWLARRPVQRADTYVLLLYMDSTYRLPAPGHLGEREAEYVRWADSLARRGQLDLGGKLLGKGTAAGLFIIHAPSDSAAAAIAATCPHLKYGGRIEVRHVVK